MTTDPNVITNRGVYECLDENMEIVYHGSTSLPLDKLEYNHRNWQTQKYRGKSAYGSEFRKALVTIGENWTFRWSLPPRAISIQQNEIEEGALIRAHQPRYNRSMYPYERSIYEGRYEKSV